jgi:hypothetical protein
MKSVLGRRLLAIVGTLTCFGPSAMADEVLWSGMERHLDPKRPGLVDSNVMPAAFLQDTPAAGDGQLPVELKSSGPPASLDEDVPCDAASCSPCSGNPPLTGLYHVEAQLMWLRAHITESAVGKLSEKYELSPRFILSYEDPGGVGTRVRYWTYGRWTPNLDDPDDEIRFEMNVMDVEATSRFRTARTDLVLGGGMRWADMAIALDDEEVQGDMPGLTVAADLRISLCCDRCHEWAVIGGARWSLLGGDWEGDGGFIDPVRDDNISVHELYTGVEYFCTCGDFDLYARLKYEIQNWHSDAFAEDAETDSIGFLGPGIECGITF